MKKLILCGTSLLALSACGGGSGSDTLNLEGAWQGSYSLESVFSNTPLHATIRNGGPMLLYDKTGLLYVVATTPTGADLDTSATLYPTYGFIFTNGQTTIPVSVKGTASNGNINGTLTLDGSRASYDLNRSDPFSGTPSIVQGLWSGAYIGSQDVAFRVHASGVITGSDVYGCSFTGHITQVAAGENLFDVQLTSHGLGQICGHNFKGLAYESDNDQENLYGNAPGPYYYISAYGTKMALVAEVKVQ